ncbi:MAG: RecX family transcriptional regulator [Calditrichaceae bacterium]|nr:RecX family transcriptional regulator [Calditrichaceae bacterium]MBN2708508.1 RecX family transcriptional regulator [Calditrichaceae bacterium]
MIIDKIEKQKNKNIYHLYAENAILMTLTEDTIVKFNIYGGKEISQNQLDEIHDYDQTIQCVHQAYRFLSRRAHLVKEIERKLYKKSYSKTTINKAVAILKEKGYLYDEDFITMYIREEINIKRSGPLLIRKKLMEKGASREQVDKQIEQLYDEEKQKYNAGKLLIKKQMNKTTVTRTEIQKLQRFLLSKGYGWDVIHFCLDKYTIE